MTVSFNRVLWLAQAHLEPGMSLHHWKEIMTKHDAPHDLKELTDQQVEVISHEIIKIVNLSMAEVVAQIAANGGYLMAEDGRLLVRGVKLTERLRVAISYYRDSLYRHVSAFPGQRWPTELKGGDSVECRKNSRRVSAVG